MINSITAQNCLATVSPLLALEWDYQLNELKPEEVSRYSNKKVWWKCSKNHSWEQTISQREPNRCPYCTHQRASLEYCLFTTNPELVSQWDKIKNTLNPADLTPGSSRKIWWTCDQGHNWCATPKSRTQRATGCPICARKLSFRSVTLKDGTVCDSIVDAFVYLDYKSKGIEFVYNKRYGKDFGLRRFDFYIKTTNTFVEVTSFEKNWNGWETYKRNIAIKREYVLSIGAKFEFYVIRMTRKQIDFVKQHIIQDHVVKYMSFLEARDFSRSLCIKNQKSWDNYCKSHKCPTEIPSYPDRIYRFCGWKGYGDWLGTRRASKRKLRSFQEAREFVRSLGIKTTNEWYSLCKNGELPNDIPSCPRSAYLHTGWVNFGDWLGTGTLANQDKKFRNFDKARNFARLLNLSSESAWRIYLKSGNKPEDIPSSPSVAYRHKGWISWQDWLGNEVRRIRTRFLSYTEAKKFVHRLNIKNTKEWELFCASGKLPHNIPSCPDSIYKKRGWISMGDWLGTDSIASSKKSFMEFVDARNFIHQLGLKTQKDWEDYRKSNKKPVDIPTNPQTVYKNDGWISNGDWLGTGIIATKNIIMMPFEQARTFALSLGLKNRKEWREYSKSGLKPHNIPVNGDVTYADHGWKGWNDWLGVKCNETIICKNSC